MTKAVKNFGHNVSFTPRQYFEPETEERLLELLDENREGQVRVVGSRHSWSDAIVSEDVLISMKNFASIEVIKRGNDYHVIVGGGCQIKHLLHELNKQGLTLPSVGLISEQTIAGATSTGTHGSGKQSLSHFIKAARIACFDKHGNPVIRQIDSGTELLAARCSLGCLGVVVSLELPCVPQYNVQDSFRFCSDLDSALESENHSQLQQFFLLPYRWIYSVQERTICDRPIGWSSYFYRFYRWFTVDVMLHLLIKFSAGLLRSQRLVHFVYYLVPLFLIRKWKPVDRSEKILVMEHELFRHFEMEAFVEDRHLKNALRVVECVLRVAKGESLDLLPDDLQESLDDQNLLDRLQSIQGTFAHHFPICIRKILKDDTLISMSSGQANAWYSISLITYVEPREAFKKVAAYLADTLQILFGGRIHWGKWLPWDQQSIEKAYPELPEFRRICHEFDPNQVFQNKFTRLICESNDSQHVQELQNANV